MQPRPAGPSPAHLLRLKRGRPDLRTCWEGVGERAEISRQTPGAAPLSAASSRGSARGHGGKALSPAPGLMRLCRRSGDCNPRSWRARPGPAARRSGACSVPWSRRELRSAWVCAGTRGEGAEARTPLLQVAFERGMHVLRLCGPGRKQMVWAGLGCGEESPLKSHFSQVQACDPLRTATGA